MKKLSVLLLIALSSALLMTGCGKEEEPEVIEEAVVVETPVDEPETETEPEADTEKDTTDTTETTEQGPVDSVELPELVLPSPEQQEFADMIDVFISVTMML